LEWSRCSTSSDFPFQSSVSPPSGLCYIIILIGGYVPFFVCAEQNVSLSISPPLSTPLQESKYIANEES
jgi:hypothetical protein